MKKRLLGIILSFAMLISLSTTFMAKEIIQDSEDPEYWSAQGYISDSFYTESYEYSNNTSVLGRGEYTLRKGIDVSSWNGDIDWKKAKDAGVEFAIVRVGYRGYGTGKLVEDQNYKQNIEGALENDILVGVYIYSQAITVEEAIEEAEFVMSRVYMYNLSLPIVIDFEYYSGKDGESGRLHDANLSKETATKICSSFCDTVESAGHTGMVYANKSMLMNNLDGDKLAETYRIWLAHYTSKTDYSGTYDFWQYTSTGDGYAYGMGSQNVDLNWWYDDGTIYGDQYASIFNAKYYADKYADLKMTYGYNATDLLNHFLKYGMCEGRQGCEDFNVISYRNCYPDLRKVYGNSLMDYYYHYLKYGEKEGRVGIGYENYLIGATTIYNGIDYTAVYEFNEYLKNNPDVYSAYGMNDEAVLEHFILYGMQEGRKSSDTFDVSIYKDRYVDLEQAYGDDMVAYYMHYINYGQYEGRCAMSVDPYYVPVFDVKYYLDNHEDLKNAFGDNEAAAFTHFMTYGMSEGRKASESFDVMIYKEANRDLFQAYGEDIRAYYEHYLRYGINEGRVCN